MGKIKTWLISFLGGLVIVLFAYTERLKRKSETRRRQQAEALADVEQAANAAAARGAERERRASNETVDTYNRTHFE